MRRAGRWWHHGGRKRWVGFGGERGGTAGKERGVGAHKAALAAAAAAGVAGVMDAATGRRGPLQRYPFTAARSWPVPLWIAARLAPTARGRCAERLSEEGEKGGEGGTAATAPQPPPLWLCHCRHCRNGGSGRTAVGRVGRLPSLDDKE